MPHDKILTWSDYAEERRLTPGSIIHHREETYHHYLTRLWEIFHDEGGLPEKNHLDMMSINAFVNGGRWMVSCLCGLSSAPAEPGEDYCCTHCAKWSRVVWPEQRELIEASLLRLPGYRLQAPARNWRPPQ